MEQLELLDNITFKAMMGEFLLYYNNVLFGGIYDNRLLVKIVDFNDIDSSMVKIEKYFESNNGTCE